MNTIFGLKKESFFFFLGHMYTSYFTWSIFLNIYGSQATCTPFSIWWLWWHMELCQGKRNGRSFTYIYIYIYTYMLYSLYNGLPLLHKYMSMEHLRELTRPTWHNHMWYHLHSGWIVTTPLDSQLSQLTTV